MAEHALAQQTGFPGAFAVALRRAPADFIEMPGLQLTEAQAPRLWGADYDVCRAFLSALVTGTSSVRRHPLIRTTRG